MIRRLARPLLASMFVAGGIDVLRDPQRRAEAAKPVLAQVRDLSPVPLSDDDVALVRTDAAVKVGAGVLLAMGRFQRLSALVLAGGLVPTTLAAHRFWEVTDAEERRNQQVHFVKNVAMLGGLLFAAADTGGRPSVRYRTRRAARDTARRAQHTARTAQHAAWHAQHEAQHRARRTARRAQHTAGAVGERARDILPG